MIRLNVKKVMFWFLNISECVIDLIKDCEKDIY